jgi:DNA-binding beta-propeller fold protein YncE
MARRGSKSRTDDRLVRRRTGGALCAVVAVLLTFAAGARGADRIYWSNLPANVISWANLDGSGGGNLPINPSTLNGPMGLAIDTRDSTIYWSNYGNNPAESGTTISVANLDGSNAHVLPISGVGVAGPHGVAVNPAAGKVYWTNHDPNSGASWIGFANLDGSQGGVLNTGSATVQGPRGLALDPVSGILYFANWLGNTISFARLDGGGGADIPTNGATVDNPEGVALSPSQNRLYFGNFAFIPSPPQETISYVNLDGTGGANLMTAGATRDEPHGVAIDPSRGRIYWPNFAANNISYASLDGTGGADLPTGGATKDGPNLPVLLKGPVIAGPATVQGGFKPGSKLKCSGNFTPDQPASLLYQAPHSHSYKWAKRGHKLGRATSRSLKARSLGEYRCRVGAQNVAGSAAQTSGWYGVFEVARPILDPRRGTATLAVTVPGPGKLALSGKGVVKQPRVARGALRAGSGKKLRTHTARLLVRAKGKVKRHLNRTGVARVKVKVTFTAARGGAASPQVETVRLKKTRR